MLILKKPAEGFKPPTYCSLDNFIYKAVALSLSYAGIKTTRINGLKSFRELIYKMCSS